MLHCSKSPKPPDPETLDVANHPGCANPPGPQRSPSGRAGIRPRPGQTTGGWVMPRSPTLRPAALQRPVTDGWLGTPELPGYRAGNVVARLADLPAVDPDHLYFNLLLLDAEGRLQDHHSGPCRSMDRLLTVDERSRYVRVVAELMRHAPSDDRGLSAIGQALSFVRDRGIKGDRLLLAAQLVDEACSDDAVAANLVHLLTLSLGADEAARELAAVVEQLGVCQRPLANGADIRGASAAAPVSAATLAGSHTLHAQVRCVVRQVGKTQARRYLREQTGLALVPAPDLLGV